MVSILNTRTGYGLVAIALHWVMALGIFFLFGLGLYMTDLDYYDAWYHKGPDLHKALGMMVLLMLLVRIPWRLANLRPEPQGRPWEQQAARWMHNSHYLLMTVVLITGYLIPTAKGEGVDVFGLIEVPSVMRLSGPQEDLAGWIHWLSAWILVVLAVLHALAAYKHHFVDKDDTLLRMIGRKASSGPRNGTST
ncbi:MAG: cytochrome b [Gammaproteobacteria bacterium]|nr:cytochrome b [Gammaproteobacteria bacterium]